MTPSLGRTRHRSLVVVVALATFALCVSQARADEVPVEDPNAPVQLRFGPTPIDEVTPPPLSVPVAPIAPAPAPGSLPVPEAPVPRTEVRTAYHSVYVELLGAALVYSLNYDISLDDDVAVRIGVGYFEFGIFGPAHGFLLVPVTISYLGVGSLTHIFELGVGATILTESRAGDPGGSESTTTIFVHLPIGYRYQAAQGGLLFRAGVYLTAMDLEDEFLAFPWPYLALGATF